MTEHIVLKDTQFDEAKEKTMVTSDQTNKTITPDKAQGYEMRERILPESIQFHEVVDIFPKMSDEEFAGLVDDIKKNGQREPVWVNKEGLIIDGRNRALACKNLKRAVACRVYHGGSESTLAFVLSQNLSRRHLTESQRAMVATRIADMRQGTRTDLASNEAKSQSEAAEELGVSRSSLQRAAKVRKNGVPELAEKVDQGKVAVAPASDLATLPQEEQQKIIARGEEEILKAAKRIRAERQAVPKQPEARVPDNNFGSLPEDGPFSVVVINPRWPKCSARAVPVPALAQEDALVALWAPNTFLREACQCLKSWGMKPQTVLTWHKPNAKGGTLVQEVTEHCILAVRGKPDLNNTASTTLITEEQGEPERKPDAFYEIMEELSERPKLEVFGREARAGWRNWPSHEEKCSENENSDGGAGESDNE
jgi:N6-adenosine-specific RNA methylase IME4